MKEEYKLSHLKELEAESIHIIREVAAEFENPVMLYSIGKDSSVMVRLAEKAFAPGKVPFPLMHIDSKWKFKEMIQFRDEYAKKYGWNLIVESNMEAFNAGVGPFTHGSKVHTDLMKTQALLHALDKYKFDAAFGGARRDEEKSRAKERIFSFRDKFHQWDPKNQRPELWDIYNARVHKGESIRVFPLSNWTELDIWQYIRLENIPIVPLYFAKERPCVEIDGNLIMADDDRLPEQYRDQIKMRMVRLAEKAFAPGKVPFPLMHIDSKWKFKEMIQFRDEYAKKYGWNLIVESNMEAFNAGVGPFTHGSKVHTDLMKTQALLHALDKYKFDAAFGGARRDEEKSRAKERIFSFRDKFHQWDPKNQRPELWDIYNARVHKGESIRVFPLSNWTELDIWQYIRLENIPIVPLYFAKERPCVEIDGNLIMADDDRLPEQYRDQIKMRMVRFRTLGCWPLTGAVESDADTIEKIVEEMMTTTKSERTTRVIDFDQDASMEQKKREGYF